MRSIFFEDEGGVLPVEPCVCVSRVGEVVVTAEVIAGLRILKMSKQSLQLIGTSRPIPKTQHKSDFLNHHEFAKSVIRFVAIPSDTLYYPRVILTRSISYIKCKDFEVHVCIQYSVLCTVRAPSLSKDSQLLKFSLVLVGFMAF